MRPQGPRWACGARPCSGPMPPGCRLHSVGFGSLNGRCGACPEDIFQLVRTLATTALRPSASQALALRRPGPCRDCWVRPRRAGGRAAAALAAVRFVAPRLRGSACPVETWRTPRANGRPRKRRVVPARAGWPRTIMARGSSRDLKLEKVESQSPELFFFH